MKYNEYLRLMEEYELRTNLLQISKSLIKEERDKAEKSLVGDITYVVSKNQKGNIEQWGGNVNVYLRVKTRKSGYKYAIMHVTGGYCVIIPYIMKCKDGKLRNLIGQLSKHYYCLNGRNNVCTGDKMNNIYLYRQILAFYHYGDIDAKLPDGYEVHHVDRRFYNIIECLRLVTKGQHTQFTKKDKSKWRVKGKKMHSLRELEKFLLSIEDVANDCSEKEM